MRVVLRVLTAFLCVVLVGTVTYGAELIDREEGQPVEPESTQVTSGSVALTCPGPAQLAEGDWDRDAAFDPSPVGTKSAVAGAVLAPAEPADDGLLDLAGEDSSDMTVGRDAAVVATTKSDANVLWARPDPQGIVRAAGVASSVTAEGDLRGLAAMSCTPGEVEQWLVGGSTILGTSSRLVLQNPSRTPAAVQVEVWGPSGRLELAGPSSFSVPAGGQTATLLEGLASEQRRLAVRVVSSGALVSSYLQVNELEGLRPLGMDFVAPSANPTRRQVVTGLTVQDSEIGDDAAASIRLLAPGEKAADVKVTILGQQGRLLLPGTESVNLAAGAVTDVSLAGLDAGTYAVVLESNEPIVAGGRIVRQASGTETEGEQPNEVAYVAPKALRTDQDEVAEASGTDDVTDAPHESISGPGRSGVVSLPRFGTAELNLLLVPPDVRGVEAAGRESEADTGTGSATEEGDDVASDAEPVEASVVLVDGSGQAISTSSVDLIPGQVRVVDPAKLAEGHEVAAIYVTVPDATESILSWSVLARAGEVSDELVSVLLPVAPIDTRSEFTLRPGTSTGLGTRAD